MGYVIILGGGNFGEELVKRFVDENWKVTLIDMNIRVCRDITDTYGIKTIHGDGTDPEVLEEADIEKADIFIAATPKDEINILSAFLAKEKGAKRIIVRISNKNYEKILERVGFEYILPEEVAAKDLFEKIIHPNIKNIAKFSDFYIAEIEVNENLFIIGKKLKEIENNKVKILFYKTDKLEEYNPDVVIQKGMKIYILSKVNPAEVIKSWEL